MKYLLSNLKGIIKRVHFKKLITDKHFLLHLRNGTKTLKLDVCGGRFPYGHGYMNVDIQRLPEVDIIADIRKKIPVPDNTVSEIFSCGTLEHFSLEEIDSILREFCRILRPGGRLIIGVPSLKKICDAYLSGEMDFDMVNQYLYGAQKTKYDIHKSIFDFENIKVYLKNTGFCEIEEAAYDMPFHLSRYMMKVICKKA